MQRRYAGRPTRKGTRLPVNIRVEIGGARGVAMGVARDITHSGIQIITRRDYPVGDRFAVTLSIPGFAPQFDFAVEVCWVDFAGKQDLYTLGCRFVHTKESREKLRQLIWEITSGNVPEVARGPKARKRVRRGKKRTP